MAHLLDQSQQVRHGLALPLDDTPFGRGFAMQPKKDDLAQSARRRIPVSKRPAELSLSYPRNGTSRRTLNRGYVRADSRRYGLLRRLRSSQ
jgi:hypothetical protein